MQTLNVDKRLAIGVVVFLLANLAVLHSALNKMQARTRYDRVSTGSIANKSLPLTSIDNAPPAGYPEARIARLP